MSTLIRLLDNFATEVIFLLVILSYSTINTIHAYRLNSQYMNQKSVFIETGSDEDLDRLLRSQGLVPESELTENLGSIELHMDYDDWSKLLNSENTNRLNRNTNGYNIPQGVNDLIQKELMEYVSLNNNDMHDSISLTQEDLDKTSKQLEAELYSDINENAKRGTKGKDSEHLENIKVNLIAKYAEKDREEREEKQQKKLIVFGEGLGLEENINNEEKAFM